MLIEHRQGLFCPFLLFIFGSFAAAQIVGTKDLTKQLPPAAGDAKTQTASQTDDYCFPSGGHADGVIVSVDKDPVLTLSIAKAQLLFVDQKPIIDMTLVLKNHGIGPALVPWSSLPVEPAELSNENNMRTTGYEVATVDFFLGAPHTKNEMLDLYGPNPRIWPRRLRC